MARTVAIDEGLKYVYEGNVISDGSNTYCPACGRLLVQRVWHEVVRSELINGDTCACGEKIPMVV
ncbi:MAG: hypothetical protein FJ088_06110 [Deltaproteobacteria bacterium]|nr:hypothetical protein [Deltaproteobacteria bacterium]